MSEDAVEEDVEELLGELAEYDDIEEMLDDVAEEADLDDAGETGSRGGAFDAGP